VPGEAFSVRVSDYQGNKLVNICDAELIGRTVTEGRLKVHISREFYWGELVDGIKALGLITSCSIVNLTGRRSVALAIDNSIGSAAAVREIEDVPFLMIYKFMR
jgi:uncharacterized protein